MSTYRSPLLDLPDAVAIDPEPGLVVEWIRPPPAEPNAP